MSADVNFYDKIIISVISGMAGCILTLIIGGLVWFWRRHREYQLLKDAIRRECLSIISMIESVRMTYSSVYENNEWRADDSLLLRAKELLMTKFNDDKLLGAVSIAAAWVGELNRLLELYRNECFHSSQTVLTEVPLYISRMHDAVLASFAKTSNALLGLAEHITPKLVSNG